ncbi:MAG: DUF177 domain-containing protein [Oscillospiraceae bacterium]
MLDLRKWMRPGAEAEEASESYDFSGRDFYGFAVEKPVHMHYRLTPTGAGVRLWLQIDAELNAECARCLGPAVHALHVESNYTITPEELLEDFPQLPMQGSLLDLEELAYGEVVMETPASIVCRDDCAGLCQTCGAPLGQCGCPKDEGGDVRWQVLRDLLKAQEENI